MYFERRGWCKLVLLIFLNYKINQRKPKINRKSTMNLQDEKLFERKILGKSSIKRK